jgi:hypothetical protein
MDMSTITRAEALRSRVTIHEQGLEYVLINVGGYLHNELVMANLRISVFLRCPVAHSEGKTFEIVGLVGLQPIF